MRPGLALTPNVVLVPRTNIAAWVRALGRLCIVVMGAGLVMSTYRRLQTRPSPRASFSSRRPAEGFAALRCVSSPRAGAGAAVIAWRASSTRGQWCGWGSRVCAIKDVAHRQSRRRKEVAGGDGISGRRPLGRGSRVGMSQASGTPALSDNGGRKRDGDVRQVGRSNEREMRSELESAANLAAIKFMT
ncbi:hypothetical protein C8J57DRAFT_1423624 [Mycena rebaudengoi]|nr:hypothetical protein C8J57DRAFT_1423624 [Mycena rebaudengoi]